LWFGIFHARGDYDFLRDFLIDWRDVVPTIAAMKDSDDRAVSADDWANNAPFSAAIRANRADLDQDTVPMHR